MKRIRIICRVIALIVISIGTEVGAQDDLNAAFAAAPAEVRTLQCRDIASLSSEDSVAVRRWLRQVMEPVARAGMRADEIYNQFLVECARNQGSSVVAAAVDLRRLLEGLTPQHAGGK